MIMLSIKKKKKKRQGGKTGGEGTILATLGCTKDYIFKLPQSWCGSLKNVIFY